MAPETLDDMNRALSGLRSEMLGAESLDAEGLMDLPAETHVSARNLLHYLALRRHDLRLLQRQLESLGLSSLEGSESRVLENVDAVIGVLQRLDATSQHGIPAAPGRALLAAHTDALFGPAPYGRVVRIMVTMPSEPAADDTLVRSLLTSGMDCVRINCAHGNQDEWDRLLHAVRRASQDTGRSCRALMDLAGPKLRTCAIEAGPSVVRWRPQRDVFGRPVTPARIWLTPRQHPRGAPAPDAVTLPVDETWVAQLTVGERITLVDARDAKREMTVSELAPGGAWADALQTAYVVPGTALVRERWCAGQRRTYVEDLPPTSLTIDLSAGDTLILTKDSTPGRPATRDQHGAVLAPARIGVTLPAMLDDVKPGEAVWFDDGRIGGVVRQVTATHVLVAITHANSTGLTLGADKGINLPDSALAAPPLTEKDQEDLRFIAGRADIVGYSFAHSADDVRLLQTQLHALGRPDLPVILKIETRRAVDHLPALLIAIMHSAAAGVMIARGDLAVECGFERLAEVQEEILWMAEASHLPVIWATQVLETLAKRGMPSRAEITDAAMGERAECVMLNKGPYIVNAVRALATILARMQAHHRKKSAILSRSRIANRFFRR